MSLILRPAPAPARLPALDESQENALLAAEEHANVVIIGAPGTGKTTVAQSCFVRRVSRSAPKGLTASRHVLLAPTRVGAARARDVAAHELLAEGITSRDALAVHTPQAFAFGIVREFAVLNGEPAPLLISGAEQDRILAELLAGHLENESLELPWPSELPREVMGIKAFRDELRDLFMRAAEFSLSGEDLARLGSEHGRPEWLMAADLWNEYRNVVSLESSLYHGTERFDAARVVGEAATRVEKWAEFTDAPLPRVESIVVDDYQESSAALVRLLEAFSRVGTRLTLVGDPDVAVQTFRGAQPSFLGQASNNSGFGGFGAEIAVLENVHRGSKKVRDLVVETASRVPTTAGAEHRKASVPIGRALTQDQAEARHVVEAVRATKLSSEAAEIGFIAHLLRDAHLHRGLPWDSMAVIVRSSTAQRELNRGLHSLGVPINPTDGAIVLQEAPAVLMLLDALEAAGAEVMTDELVQSLLRSALGGFDPLAIRRLRRYAVTQIREHEESAEGIDTYLGTLPTSNEPLDGVPEDLHDGITRIRRTLAATRAALEAEGANAHTVLSAAWEASGLPDVWRDLALSGGIRGELADQDLDALVALFSAAEDHAARHPGASALVFGEAVRSETLPRDSLAPRGQTGIGVDVVTVAEAAGREWDIVVISGLQEGSWPNPRLRDSVLAAGKLADIQLGRLGHRGSNEHVSYSEARQQVMADEWRMLTSAVSRARTLLVATAVEDLDQRPSVFFEVISQSAELVEEPRSVRRLDLRGMVSELRAILDTQAAAETFEPLSPGPEDGTADESLHATAAALLGALAAAGAPGASPAEWAGLADPTPLAPLAQAGEPVVVSPSRVESVTTCPLRWALDRAGGRTASKIEQNLGTLIHEIAAEYPHGTEEELLLELKNRFDSLGLSPGWIHDREHQKATEMLQTFAKYAESVPGKVRTEVPISQKVGDAVVKGRVDRLEYTDEGVRIADIKTGSSKITEAEALEHPQLGIYQLAVNESGETADGARLVYVANEGRDANRRLQPRLEEDGGFARELLETAVTWMRSASFPPVVNPGCRHCPVRTSCPAQAEGMRSAQ